MQIAFVESNIINHLFNIKISFNNLDNSIKLSLFFIVTKFLKIEPFRMRTIRVSPSLRCHTVIDIRSFWIKMKRIPSFDLLDSFVLLSPNSCKMLRFLFCTLEFESRLSILANKLLMLLMIETGNLLGYFNSEDLLILINPTFDLLIVFLDRCVVGVSKGIHIYVFGFYLFQAFLLVYQRELII